MKKKYDEEMKFENPFLNVSSLNFEDLNKEIMIDLPEIDQDNQDFGILEEEEDMIVYRPPVVTVSKEKLLQLTLNFSISDIFVEKPYSRKYKQKLTHTFSKQNFFIVNRLNHMLPLSILLTYYQYNDDKKYHILNIFDYINTLGYLIQKFSIIRKLNNNTLFNHLYVSIYKFLTSVYITVSPDEDLFYLLEEKEIYFHYIYRMVDFDQDNFDKIKNSKNCRENWVKYGVYYFDLELDVNKFYLRYCKEYSLQIVSMLNQKYEKEFKITTLSINEIQDYLE